MNSQVLYAVREDGKLEVKSPFLPLLPPKAKALGGRWDAIKGVWVYDARDREAVRKMYTELFGDENEPLVTVQLRLGPCYGLDELLFGGRVIARRRYRDAAVLLGEGVIILSGGFPSRGGSMKHPRLAPLDNTILQVRDVPVSLATKPDFAETIAIIEG